MIKKSQDSQTSGQSTEKFTSETIKKFGDFADLLSKTKTEDEKKKIAEIIVGKFSKKESENFLKIKEEELEKKFGKYVIEKIVFLQKVIQEKENENEKNKTTKELMEKIDKAVEPHEIFIEKAKKIVASLGSKTEIDEFNSKINAIESKISDIKKLTTFEKNEIDKIKTEVDRLEKDIQEKVDNQKKNTSQENEIKSFEKEGKEIGKIDFVANKNFSLKKIMAKDGTIFSDVYPNLMWAAPFEKDQIQTVTWSDNPADFNQNQGLRISKIKNIYQKKNSYLIETENSYYILTSEEINKKTNEKEIEGQLENIKRIAGVECDDELAELVRIKIDELNRTESTNYFANDKKIREVFKEIKDKKDLVEEAKSLIGKGTFNEVQEIEEKIKNSNEINENKKKEIIDFCNSQGDILIKKNKYKGKNIREVFKKRDDILLRGIDGITDIAKTKKEMIEVKTAFEEYEKKLKDFTNELSKKFEEAKQEFKNASSKEVKIPYKLIDKELKEKSPDVLKGVQMEIYKGLLSGKEEDLEKSKKNASDKLKEIFLGLENNPDFINEIKKSGYKDFAEFKKMLEDNQIAEKIVGVMENAVSTEIERDVVLNGNIGDLLSLGNFVKNWKSSKFSKNWGNVLKIGGAWGARIGASAALVGGATALFSMGGFASVLGAGMLVAKGGLSGSIRKVISLTFGKKTDKWLKEGLEGIKDVQKRDYIEGKMKLFEKNDDENRLEFAMMISEALAQETYNLDSVSDEIKDLDVESRKIYTEFLKRKAEIGENTSENERNILLAFLQKSKQQTEDRKKEIDKFTDPGVLDKIVKGLDWFFKNLGGKEEGRTKEAEAKAYSEAREEVEKMTQITDEKSKNDKVKEIAENKLRSIAWKKGWLGATAAGATVVTSMSLLVQNVGVVGGASLGAGLLGLLGGVSLGNKSAERSVKKETELRGKKEVDEIIKKAVEILEKDPSNLDLDEEQTLFTSLQQIYDGTTSNLDMSYFLSLDKVKRTKVKKLLEEAKEKGISFVNQTKELEKIILTKTEQTERETKLKNILDEMSKETKLRAESEIKNWQKNNKSNVGIVKALLWGGGLAIVSAATAGTIAYFLKDLFPHKETESSHNKELDNTVSEPKNTVDKTDTIVNETDTISPVDQDDNKQITALEQAGLSEDAIKSLKIESGAEPGKIETVNKIITLSKEHPDMDLTKRLDSFLKNGNEVEDFLKQFIVKKGDSYSSKAMEQMQTDKEYFEIKGKTSGSAIDKEILNRAKDLVVDADKYDMATGKGKGILLSKDDGKNLPGGTAEKEQQLVFVNKKGQIETINVKEYQMDKIVAKAPEVVSQKTDAPEIAKGEKGSFVITPENVDGGTKSLTDTFNDNMAKLKAGTLKAPNGYVYPNNKMFTDEYVATRDWVDVLQNQADKNDFLNFIHLAKAAAVVGDTENFNHFMEKASDLYEKAPHGKSSDIYSSSKGTGTTNQEEISPAKDKAITDAETHRTKGPVKLNVVENKLFKTVTDNFRKIESGEIKPEKVSGELKAYQKEITATRPYLNNIPLEGDKRAYLGFIQEARIASEKGDAVGFANNIKQANELYQKVTGGKAVVDGVESGKTPKELAFEKESKEESGSLDKDIKELSQKSGKTGDDLAESIYEYKTPEHSEIKQALEDSAGKGDKKSINLLKQLENTEKLKGSNSLKTTAQNMYYGKALLHLKDQGYFRSENINVDQSSDSDFEGEPYVSDPVERAWNKDFIKASKYIDELAKTKGNEELAMRWKNDLNSLTGEEQKDFVKHILKSEKADLEVIEDVKIASDREEMRIAKGKVYDKMLKDKMSSYNESKTEETPKAGENLEQQKNTESPNKHRAEALKAINVEDEKPVEKMIEEDIEENKSDIDNIKAEQVARFENRGAGAIAEITKNFNSKSYRFGGPELKEEFETLQDIYEDAVKNGKAGDLEAVAEQLEGLRDYQNFVNSKSNIQEVIRYNNNMVSLEGRDMSGKFGNLYRTGEALGKKWTDSSDLFDVKGLKSTVKEMTEFNKEFEKMTVGEREPEMTKQRLNMFAENTKDMLKGSMSESELKENIRKTRE